MKTILLITLVILLVATIIIDKKRAHDSSQIVTPVVDLPATDSTKK